MRVSSLIENLLISILIFVIGISIISSVQVSNNTELYKLLNSLGGSSAGIYNAVVEAEKVIEYQAVQDEVINEVSTQSNDNKIASTAKLFISGVLMLIAILFSKKRFNVSFWEVGLIFCSLLLGISIGIIWNL